tara:strand:- start:788 stop:994 length:207 start_codon:yes stop_codon:yes gene_type:complete
MEAFAQVGTYVWHFFLVVGISCLQPENWNNCQGRWVEPYVCDAVELYTNGPYANEKQTLRRLGNDGTD